MSEVIYVPPSCLDDARQVLGAQDPDAARRAEQRWPGRVWRQAVKLAGAEIEQEARHAA